MNYTAFQSGGAIKSDNESWSKHSLGHWTFGFPSAER